MQKRDPREFKEFDDYTIKKEVTSSLWKIKSKKNNKDFANKFLSQGEAEAYLYKFIKLKFYTDDEDHTKKVNPNLEPVPEYTTFHGIVKIGNKLINPKDKDSKEVLDALRKKEQKEIELVQIRNNRKLK